MGKECHARTHAHTSTHTHTHSLNGFKWMNSVLTTHGFAARQIDVCTAASVPWGPAPMLRSHTAADWTHANDVRMCTHTRSVFVWSQVHNSTGLLLITLSIPCRCDILFNPADVLNLSLKLKWFTVHRVHSLCVCYSCDLLILALGTWWTLIGDTNWPTQLIGSMRLETVLWVDSQTCLRTKWEPPLRPEPGRLRRSAEAISDK